MKNFEQFNENKTTEPRVINPEMFGQSEANLFSRMKRNGFTPYHMDSEYNLVELEINSNGYPSKRVEQEKRNEYGRVLQSSYLKSLKRSENKLGRIYFIREEEMKELKPIADKIQELVKMYKKQLDLTVDLFGSKLTHMKDEKS